MSTTFDTMEDMENGEVVEATPKKKKKVIIVGEAIKEKEASKAEQPKLNFEIPLMDELRSLDGSSKEPSYFDTGTGSLSYKTGIPQLDYYLGYRVNSYNKNNEIIKSYNAVGIGNGSIVTFIGKPSTSKTTTAVQIAGNIVRPFQNGSVIHFDLEQGMNYSRVQNLTRFPMPLIQAGKYTIRQELNSIGDIKKSIMKLYFTKVQNTDKYQYNSHELNEFGEEIITYEPSVVIIDSIASLGSGFSDGDKKSIEKLEEIGSQTEKMRVTAEIGRFFTEILPYLKKANIILICINQIKSKPQLGFLPQPADLLYLNQDESLPGGKAPAYYASVMLKFIAVGSEKYTEEDDGFGGFGVKAMVIKSRGNQAGRFVSLIYDKVRGIDALRSSIKFAKDSGLTGGNKNSFYFLSDKEEKFSLKHVHEDFKERRHLYRILYDNIVPLLESKLSMLQPDELDVLDEEFDY